MEQVAEMGELLRGAWWEAGSECRRRDSPGVHVCVFVCMHMCRVCDCRHVHIIL